MAHLAMRMNADGDATANAPLTPARLRSTPLADLLVEANADVIEAVEDYPDFDGQTLRMYEGRNLVVLPKGSSLRDREVLARQLIGRLLGGAR